MASGAVDAAFALPRHLGCAEAINDAVQAGGGHLRTRDGLSVGESLVAVAVACLVHPSSKRAIAEWTAHTSLPVRGRECRCKSSPASTSGIRWTACR